jgi:hypothetical protein
VVLVPPSNKLSILARENLRIIRQTPRIDPFENPHTSPHFLFVTCFYNNQGFIYRGTVDSLDRVALSSHVPTPIPPFLCLKI